MLPMFQLISNSMNRIMWIVRSNRKGRAMKTWAEYINDDMPKRGPVTKESIECTLKEARRFRGSVRLSTGRLWTDEDFEARRNRVLNIPLK